MIWAACQFRQNPNAFREKPQSVSQDKFNTSDLTSKLFNDNYLRGNPAIVLGLFLYESKYRKLVLNQ